MSTLDGLTLFIVFAAVWLVIILGFAYWITVIELPKLLKALKESGMSDKEVSRDMVKIVFPPRFFK